ncbi:DUF2513 domain-containing protein [Yoonia sp. I 8.24]|jgi:hypothetical protein|uniref:DUF2513 domain-containing protein n=1 Tax=Yoonia sp. I 8.24 TaxID=1537229 RepID=UPI001EE092D0|nr:DUF2513 domain-containing protein [Yoonia sp. I 8.24]MCG3269399.1 DUF2513 domain-containing protein [Yoonia sp. I 8.24]
MPKRNLDRIREIIVEVIDMPSQYDDGFVDFSKEMKSGDSYQLYLMQNAGLIEGKSSKDGFFFITNQGQDYYDAVCSESIWLKTKAAVTETGGNATLEVVKQLAVGYLKKSISEKTGIEL